MTKEEKIELVESRIRFLSVWKEITNRRKAFAPMFKIFELLEADYSKCIIPDEKEMVYRHFKDESFKRIVPIKLGKYLVKHYKNLVPADHILSDFVAMLNAIIWKKPPQINVYKGKDLLIAYERCNYKESVQSCMTTKERIEYLKILADNPDKVELHCYEDAEDIYSRVLVWTLDCGKKIVDRIYPNEGTEFYEMLEHYTGLDNYYIRNHHTKYDVEKNPIEIIGLGFEPTIVLKDETSIHYPYLDTFQFGYKKEGKLFLSTVKKNDPFTNLQFNKQYGHPSIIE